MINTNGIVETGYAGTALRTQAGTAVCVSTPNSVALIGSTGRDDRYLLDLSDLSPFRTEDDDSIGVSDSPSRRYLWSAQGRFASVPLWTPQWDPQPITDSTSGALTDLVQLSRS